MFKYETIIGTIFVLNAEIPKYSTIRNDIDTSKHVSRIVYEALERLNEELKPKHINESLIVNEKQRFLGEISNNFAEKSFYKAYLESNVELLKLRQILRVSFLKNKNNSGDTNKFHSKLNASTIKNTPEFNKIYDASTYLQKYIDDFLIQINEINTIPKLEVELDKMYYKGLTEISRKENTIIKSFVEKEIKLKIEETILRHQTTNRTINVADLVPEDLMNNLDISTNNINENNKKQNNASRTQDKQTLSRDQAIFSSYIQNQEEMMKFVNSADFSISDDLRIIQLIKRSQMFFYNLELLMFMNKEETKQFLVNYDIV